ncbi:hypothetical protein SAMN04487844_1245 [Methylobacterium sp. yr596]|jgi:hypothetical protein|nr:hypothetical protein SAMN04487844_1245 [Methylobacterium sp. yr596]
MLLELCLQLQVQAGPNGTLAAVNAYKGSGGSPIFPYSDSSTTGAGSGNFRFKY